MRANDGDRHLRDSLQTMFESGATVSGTTTDDVLLGRDQGRIAFFVGVAAVVAGVALMPFTTIIVGLLVIGVGLLLAILFRMGAIATDVTYNQLVMIDTLRQLLAQTQRSSGSDKKAD
jgi:hypothetical protein